MRRIILIVLAALTWAVATHAQLNPAQSHGAPTGLCTGSYTDVDLDTGNFYTCKNSVWVLGGANTSPGVVYANNATGADIGAQINAAEALLPANGGVINILPGSYNLSTQIIINKTVMISGLGGGYEQNIGQHAAVRLTWTSGAGPVFYCGTSTGIGSRIENLEINNTSTTLVGFIKFENVCGGTEVNHVWIDRPTVKALSYCLQIGDPVNGPINYFYAQIDQFSHCAPTGFWASNVTANAYFAGVWVSQNGYAGTVNTSNGALGSCAANCFQLATGANYPSDTSWNGLPVAIGSTRFTVSAMNDATSGTLTSAPGTQTGVAFAFASQGTFGSNAGGVSTIFASHDSYWRAVAPSNFPSEALEDALPVNNYINIAGSHVHTGDTWEVSGNSGLTGFAMETAVAGTITGAISCFGCTMNATIGVGQVNAFVHANTSTANIQLFGTSFGDNAGILTNPAYIFKNDSSQSILADGSIGKLTVVLNYATGTLATTNGNFIDNSNGTTDMGNLLAASTSFGAFNANVVKSTGDANCARKSGGDVCKFFFGTGTHYIDFGVTSAGTWSFSAGTINTPSQFISSLATGTAPFSVASTTTIPNLTASNHPKIQFCGTTSTCSATAEVSDQIVYGSAALVSGTPSAVTITGISPAFTSTTSYRCTATDDTTATNDLLLITAVSGSSFTITGPATTTDVVGYVCVGH